MSTSSETSSGSMPSPDSIRNTLRTSQESQLMRPPVGRSSSDMRTAPSQWSQRTSSHANGYVPQVRPTPLPTFSDTLLYDSPSMPRPEMSTEARRQSIVAMDRKRRLPPSIQENSRRRTAPSGFLEREDRYYTGASSTRPQSNSFRRPSNERSPPEVIDLTQSSPPEQHATLPVPANRTSSSRSHSYVVPPWQPDSEASECPICKRAFTFLFRRHHCRKCGRVVCNDCSPHRITIPRPFIVNAPGYDGQPSTSSRISRQDFPSAGYTPSNENAHSRDMYMSSGAMVTSAGGGEKVRLCNPCVPDPQPEPPPIYNVNVPRQQSRWPIQPSMPPLPTQSSLPSYRSYMASSFTGGGGGNSSSRNPYVRPEHGSSRPLITSIDDDSGSESGPSPENHILRSQLLTNPVIFRPSFNHSSHNRFHSLDPNGPRLPPLIGNRPRVRSMLDGGHYHPRSVPGSSPSGPSSRPRVREEDVCPVCRRLLPPRDPDGSETVREAHIMDCINSHDTTAAPPPSASPAGRITSNSATSPEPSASLPRPPMQMLRFTATEKDCVGEDGTMQECLICMNEYDVGDGLARLECWCKFHAECILEWFGRKQECPVHKIA